MARISVSQTENLVLFVAILNDVLSVVLHIALWLHLIIDAKGAVKSFPQIVITNADNK